jgi:hypothetical protein
LKFEPTDALGISGFGTPSDLIEVAPTPSAEHGREPCG